MVCGTDLAVRSLVEDRVCPPIFLFKRVHKWNNVPNGVSDPAARVRPYKAKSKPGEEGIKITWIGLLQCTWRGQFVKSPEPEPGRGSKGAGWSGSGPPNLRAQSGSKAAKQPSRVPSPSQEECKTTRIINSNTRLNKSQVPFCKKI